MSDAGRILAKGDYEELLENLDEIMSNGHTRRCNWQGSADPCLCNPKCRCGHEFEYHEEWGCTAEVARDESCPCEKFDIVLPERHAAQQESEA